MKVFLVACVAILTSLCAEQGIHKHGYWQGIDITDQHVFDPYLAKGLINFFTEEQAHCIVDFGCGMGDYVKALRTATFDCQGYDGNPDTYQLSNGVANVLDLSQSFDLGKRFDWVLCLEVGEHLPACYETTLIENLDRHNIDGVVLSWAIEGQGGFGHFNTRNNDYIKNIMKNLGYQNDVEAEELLRKCSSLPWFKNTIMVFRKYQ